MANGAFYSAEVTAQDIKVTTDATPIVALSAPMPPNTSGVIDLMIVARDAGNGDSKCWMRAVPLKRTTGNVAILGAQGDMLPTAQDSGASTWALSLSTVGDSMNMNVTGAAGRTIHWYARASGVIVG